MNKRAISQPEPADCGIDLGVADGEYLCQQRINVEEILEPITASLKREFADAHKAKREALVDAALDAAVEFVRETWADHWTDGRTPLNEAFSPGLVRIGLLDNVYGHVIKTDEAFQRVARVATAYALGQVNLWAANRHSVFKHPLRQDAAGTDTNSW